MKSFKQMSQVIALLFIGVLFLVGCGEKSTSTTKESSTSTEALSDKITITDGQGTKVEVPTNPKKVVVFDMGSLDTIQTIGKSDSVIATATKSLPKYLSDFSSVESAGGVKEPDMEKINALQPDLIIISGRQSDFQEELAKIAPTIFLGVDATDTWNSTKKNIETLATIYGQEDEAKTKINALEKRITSLKEKAEASNLKTLVTLVNEGSISAYGSKSRFGIVHDVFGFKQADDKIEVSTHGQSVSYEYLLEKNPDVLFVVDRTKAIGGDETNNDLTKNELVAQTTAAKNKKIISLTSDVWYLAGGGLQSTDLMIDDVEKALK